MTTYGTIIEEPVSAEGAPAGGGTWRTRMQKLCTAIEYAGLLCGTEEAVVALAAAQREAALMIEEFRRVTG